MADGLKPAYLFSGDDGAKLDRALERLRARAEREGGAAGLETFAGEGARGPDVDRVAAAIPAISLMAEQRYLLVEGVDRWTVREVKVLESAIPSLPPETYLVLVARGKPPKGLAKLVEGIGGESISFAAPKRGRLPAWAIESARERGFELDSRAAKLLVDRVGGSTMRIAAELDKLALWAEAPDAGGPPRVGVEEVEAMTVDGSERKGWTLGDAVVARDPAGAVRAAAELSAQGEDVTPLVYGMGSRLRSAHQAASALESGRPPREVEAELPMAPYPSKLLVKAVRGVESAELSAAMVAVADLEWWARGGSAYDEETALVLAVRSAAGGAG